MVWGFASLTVGQPDQDDWNTKRNSLTLSAILTIIFVVSEIVPISYVLSTDAVYYLTDLQPGTASSPRHQGRSVRAENGRMTSGSVNDSDTEGRDGHTAFRSLRSMPDDELDLAAAMEA